MLFKRKSQSNFNKSMFDTFVEIMKKSSCVRTKANEIPIKYSYIGNEYTVLKYKYKFDEDGNAKCVLFSLPSTPQNVNMSCLVIGGANTAEDAIYSIHKIINNQYA